jgi:5-methylcytosine-specific restriction endonuclease McrA
MKFLSAPSVSSDIDYLSDICKSSTWKSYEAMWQIAYRSYRKSKGNPWKISPTKFVPDVSDAQRGLYKSKSDSSWIKDIRHQKYLQCCPMCGSLGTGSVDHYLPKEEFPEFSVMAANLVPACFNCNSGVKGQTYRGAKAQERFIHPYFDKFADEVLWFTKVVPPYDAAQFVALPSPKLSKQRQQTVSFHLKNVLGTQFHLSATNLWAACPQLIRDESKHAGLLTLQQVVSAVHVLWRRSLYSTGVNSWNSSFYRGVFHDRNAMGYLLNRADMLAASPMPKSW